MSALTDPLALFPKLPPCPTCGVGVFLPFSDFTLYGLSLFMFCLFFFGQYMMFWAETQITESNVNVVGVRMRPQQLIHFFKARLKH